jgi:hypothetical protein
MHQGGHVYSLLGYLLNKQMIIDNSCLGLANTQDERFTPFLVIKMKGNDCRHLD